MKYKITLLLAVSINLLLVGQSPQAFNYQGVTRASSGEPLVNQEIGIRVAIVKGSIGGDEIYSETHFPMTNGLGLFNIKIGTGTILSGQFNEINWGTGNHFVEISLDETGGSNFELLGTSQLLSVPYALFAENGSQWNNSENRLTTEKGCLIGSNTSFSSSQNTYPLTIVGEQALPSSPTWNRVISIRNFEEELTWYFNLIDDNLSFTEAGVEEGVLFLEKGGNVGLGTVNPNSKLHIPDGDIFIENINNGIIMKSINGQCWRYKPDNNGQLIPSAISCPN